MGASIAEPRFADARGKRATGSYALMQRFSDGVPAADFPAPMYDRCGGELNLPSGGPIKVSRRNRLFKPARSDGRTLEFV
jgi:hypothetical protein